MAEYRFSRAPVGLSLVIALLGLVVMLAGMVVTGWFWLFAVLGLAIVFGGIWGLGKAGLNQVHTYRADPSGLTYTVEQKGEVKKNLAVPWEKVTGLRTRKVKLVTWADITLADGTRLSFADDRDASAFQAIVQVVQDHLPQQR